jgi:hypothetical protein
MGVVETWPMQTAAALVALGVLMSSPGSSIQGSATYSGEQKPGAAMKVTQDQSACGQSQPDESLVVGEGGALRNVVVYLQAAPAGTSGEAPRDVTLDQVGCRFTPHVIAAQVGARLLAVNSDPVLHTVRGSPSKSGAPFSVAMPFKGHKRPVPLKRAGLLKASCDAGHPWMSAWIHVFEHPYFAVTDEKGRFTLPPLEPGTYTLIAWHERLGEKTATVTVDEKQPAPVTFDFR